MSREDDRVLAELPKVSVAIPTRGRPELLRETLTSILEQDYQGQIEILVVHDREDRDPSLEASSRPTRVVRSVVNDGTPGLAGARNTGIRLTDGPVMASCDDDDLWHSAKLRRQVDRLRSDPRLVAVGTGIRLLMGNDRIVEWLGKSEEISYERLLRNRVKELHSSTLVMHRWAFDKAGTYDESLPHGYGEDYDWLLRAARIGKLGVVNEPLADIRKDVPSWFRGRALNTAEALEYMLAKHPDIRSSRRGHSRMLGQIAYARGTAGEKRAALQVAGEALKRNPVAPHAWLAVAGTAGVSPQKLLTFARTFGRGVA